MDRCKDPGDGYEPPRGMANTNGRADINEGISKITYSEMGTMVWISDPDPEDSELRRSAESVHTHAGKMLETSRTNQELRWLANTLHQALGDTLDMSDG